MSFKNAIVLTGGIATGKSSVCSILSSQGFEIIDADKIAHQMLETHVDKIEDIFGKEYIKNGKVDRKKLGSFVFSNKKERLKLEKLLHPLIKEEIQKQADILEERKTPYIMDIPLFYEKGHYDIDKVVVVYCPKDKQLERVMQRDKLSKEEAQKRIDAQMDIEHKKVLASFIIDNSKSIKDIETEVDKFITYINTKGK